MTPLIILDRYLTSAGYRAGLSDADRAYADEYLSAPGIRDWLTAQLPDGVTAE